MLDSQLYIRSEKIGKLMIITSKITNENEKTRYILAVQTRILPVQLVSATTQLKLTAPDGKKRLTDVLNQGGVELLAKNIHNAKAMTFLDWFIYCDNCCVIFVNYFYRKFFNICNLALTEKDIFVPIIISLG